MKDREIIIKNGDLITPEGILTATDLLIRGRKVARIGKKLSPPRGAGVIDVSRHYVSPGLIDIHIHGAAGFIFGACNKEQVKHIVRLLTRFGVTGFLATIQSLPSKRLAETLETLRQAKETITPSPFPLPRGERVKVRGAELLGIHLEGPFINPARPGAHKPEYIRRLKPRELDKFQEMAGGLIKLVTLAPELPGALEMVRHLVKRGIIVAAGHSEAAYDQIETAVKKGLSHIIHLYNAMRPIHHRQPGILEAGLLMDKLSVEIICDGVHIRLPAIQLVLKCKPLDKIVLVSDSVALGLAERTTFTLGRQKYLVKGGAAWTETGRLGGSAISLLQAVQNLTRWTKLPLHQIINMASLNPARVIGMDKRLGSLEPGKDATLLILDRKLNLRQTFLKGQSIWKS
jgi:N-acetylglucosamine-6-phosphate deacetylase